MGEYRHHQFLHPLGGDEALVMQQRARLCRLHQGDGASGAGAQADPLVLACGIDKRRDVVDHLLIYLDLGHCLLQLEQHSVVDLCADLLEGVVLPADSSA
ncbi:MAG: hypothetical protein AB2820_04105 [Candidatus Thiodiazotropha sp.]